MDLFSPNIQLIRDSGIHIPYNYYKNNHKLKLLIKHLTRRVKDYNTNTFEVMKFYLSNNLRQEVIVPRYCQVEETLIENACMGEDIGINSNIQPRNKLQEEAMNWFKCNNSGILCMSPGEGKTVIAISAICNYKKKTIILVHKDPLANQWEERICQFTNYKKEDISRLATATHEKDLKKPIIISTVQTICAMYKNEKLQDRIFDIFREANIGIMIADEVHAIIGPEVFSIASMCIPAFRCYGLSATPDRINNKDMMVMHCGDIYYPEEKSINTMEPKITVIKFDHGVMSNPRLHKYIMWSSDPEKQKKGIKEFSKERYLQQLCKSKKFQIVVLDIVKKIYNTPRRMLFLSDRIDMLDWASKAVSDPQDFGFFIPRSGKERNNHLKRKMVFSTYGSARDGLDEPGLSCLVMATPTANIEQCVGRVVRTYPDKLQPIVMDLVDSTSYDMMVRYDYRKKFYESKGWKVEEKELKI